MQILIVLSSPDPEIKWNAVRFGNFLLLFRPSGEVPNSQSEWHRDEQDVAERNRQPEQKLIRGVLPDLVLGVKFELLLAVRTGDLIACLQVGFENLLAVRAPELFQHGRHRGYHPSGQASDRPERE